MDFWAVIGILLFLAILVGVVMLVVVSQQSQGPAPPKMSYPPMRQGVAPPKMGFPSVQQGIAPPKTGYSPIQQGVASPTPFFKPLGVAGAQPPTQPPGLQGIAPPAPHTFKPLGVVGAPLLSPGGSKAGGMTTDLSPASYHTQVQPLKAPHNLFEANGEITGGYCFFTGQPKAQCTCGEC